MTNVRRFFVYCILVSLSQISFASFYLGDIMKQGIHITQLMISILLAMLLLLAFMCITSWINNIYFAIYRKVKGYPLLSFNFYPFLWIKNNTHKIKLYFGITSFLMIESACSLRSIRTREELEQYIRDYKESIRNIKKLHILEFVIFLMVFVASPALSIFLCSLQAVMISLYGITSTSIMQASLYNFGVGERNEFSLLLHIISEDYDKTNLYKWAQETFVEEAYDMLLQKKFINHLLIESINDNRDYLSEDLKLSLENLFINGVDSKCYQVEYIRTVALYYMYVILMNPHDPLLKKGIENNWKEIVYQISSVPLGNKVILAVHQEEKFEINNKYEVYRKKVQKVYGQSYILNE